MNPVPALTRTCRRCHRKLRGAYAARGIGPKCGGPIKRGRKPARPEQRDGHRVDVLPGQMELWEEEQCG